jgi:hypothetical protein
VRSFIICTHPEISLGRSNKGKLGGQSMRHTWGGEKSVQDSGGKACRKESTRKTAD